MTYASLLKYVEEKLFIKREAKIKDIKELEKEIEENSKNVLKEISQKLYNISYERALEIGERFQKPIYSYFGYDEQVQIPNIELLVLEVLEDLINDKNSQQYIPHTFYESNFFVSSHSNLTKLRFFSEDEKGFIKIAEKRLSSEDLNKFQKYSIGDVTLNLEKNKSIKEYYSEILTKTGYEILDLSEKIKDLSKNLLESNYIPSVLYLKEDFLIQRWDLVENKIYKTNFGTWKDPRIIYKSLQEIIEEIEKNKYKYYRVNAKDYYPFYLLFPPYSKYKAVSHVDWIEKENNLNFVREHYDKILYVYERQNIKTPLPLVLIQFPSSTGINYTNYPKLIKNLQKISKKKNVLLDVELDEYIIDIGIIEKKLKEELKEHIYENFLKKITKPRGDLTLKEVLYNTYISIFEYLEKNLKNEYL